MSVKQSRLFVVSVCVCAFAFLASGCKSSSTVGSSTSTRTVDANTTFIQNITTTFQSTTEVCPQVSRDTSSCQSSRQALGLSGDWLGFSCNVVLGLANSSLQAVTSTAGATYVSLTSTGLPDYKSNYWPTTGTYSFSAYSYTVSGSYSSLYSAFSTPFPDPGSIGSQSTVMYVPYNPVQAAAKSQQIELSIIIIASPTRFHTMTATSSVS